MCLTLKNDTVGPITSNEDITVYKVFRKVKSTLDYKWVYTGPFQTLFEYKKLDGTYVSDEFPKKDNNLVGFHSFKEFNDAVWMMDYLTRWSHMEKEIFEIIPCTIPAGTPFLEGYYGGRECYMSKTIKLNY